MNRELKREGELSMSRLMGLTSKAFHSSLGRARSDVYIFMPFIFG